MNGMKTYWAELDPEEFRHLRQHTDENAEFMTLYRHAQPAPEKYNIGDATMRHIFMPTGMTDVSDMQAVFDRVEAVLGGMEQPAPVVPDDAKLRELFDSWFASDCSFDLSPEVSEADNIAWRESYWYVWQRCRAAMFAAAPQEDKP